MRKPLFVVMLAAFFLSTDAFALETVLRGDPPHLLEVFSQSYVIDKKYKSMEGPGSIEFISILPNEPPQLLWLTGIRTEIIDATKTQSMSPEFMCHVNVDFNSRQHVAILGKNANRSTNDRIFTLSQGTIVTDFPEGFGMPLMSNESFSIYTQVLNHNIEKPDYRVKHKVTIEFVRDRDLKKPLKPLMCTSGFAYRLIDGKIGYYGSEDFDEAKHGPSCLVGMDAAHAGASSRFDGHQGQKFTGHWAVPPGREVNTSNITKYMNIPFDTTIHYANIHVHPFAESVELKDLTTGKVLFKVYTDNFKKKIGLRYADVIVSKEGIPVYKDHEYQITDVYNNTTEQTQDAMVSIFLYILDKEFKKPVVLPAPPGDMSKIVLTDPMTIDRKLRPAEHSRSVLEPFRLSNSNPPELLWITGAEVAVVSNDGMTSMPSDYLGDVSIDLDPAVHGPLAGWKETSVSGRLFTLSKGSLSQELPKGLGIPVYSNELIRISFATMNLETEYGKIIVRYRVTIRFARDRDLKKPLTPVFLLGPASLKLAEGRDGYFGLAGEPSPKKHGVGSPAGKAPPGVYFITDSFGRKFMSVWTSPPGREENRTYATKLLRLPYNTTVHFATAYLTPFEESIELRDLTSGKTVIKLNSDSWKNRMGIKQVGMFSGKVQLFKNHEYELISVSNNSSLVEQSSMAVFYLYLADKEFGKSEQKKR